MGHQHHERSAGQESEKQAKNSSAESKQNTLGSQLANQPPAAGPCCKSHGNFLFASAGTRKQEIGHVCTSNQKEKENGGHENREWLGKLLAQCGESLSCRIHLKLAPEIRVAGCRRVERQAAQ